MKTFERIFLLVALPGLLVVAGLHSIITGHRRGTLGYMRELAVEGFMYAVTGDERWMQYWTRGG